MRVLHGVSLVLAAGFALAACADAPTGPVEVDATLAAKGGVPGPPGGGGDDDGGGGGGGGDDPPATVTAEFLLSRQVRVGSGKKGGPNANRSFSIIKMDLAGNQALAQAETDESGFDSIEPRWAPDGARFSYWRNDLSRGAFDMVVGHLDGSPSSVVAPGSVCSSTDWSPVATGDGSERIAFLSGPCDGSTGWGDLRVVRPDGTGNEQLTSTTDLRRIVWSRDARRILAHTTGPAHGLRLHEVSCSAGSCAVTASVDLDLSALGLTSADSYGSMDWARTGDEVLINVNFDDRGPGDLAILDLSDTPSLRWITRTPDADEYSASWGPDDSEIVFTRWSSSTGAAVWIRDLATGTETHLSDQYPAFGMDWR